MPTIRTKDEFLTIDSTLFGRKDSANRRDIAVVRNMAASLKIFLNDPSAEALLTMEFIQEGGLVLDTIRHFYLSELAGCMAVQDDTGIHSDWSDILADTATEREIRAMGRQNMRFYKLVLDTDPQRKPYGDRLMYLEECAVVPGRRFNVNSLYDLSAIPDFFLFEPLAELAGDFAALCAKTGRRVFSHEVNLQLQDMLLGGNEATVVFQCGLASDHVPELRVVVLSEHTTVKMVAEVGADGSIRWSSVITPLDDPSSTRQTYHLNPEQRKILARLAPGWETVVEDRAVPVALSAM